MENNFNLKKFLTENKLTNNSKILNEVSENFLDAVFNSLNDMMRAGEISGEEFDAAKNKLDSNPASLTPFEKRKDIQAAAESLLKGVNEVTDSGDEMVPNDIIWTDEDEDTASQGTFNQMDQSAEDLDGYEVEVLGYSPSTGKAYVGSTFGSYGETAFDDVDDIRQMNSKETGYYMDALKQYEPEHFKKMSQLNQETNEDQQRDHQFSANQEEEEIVMQIARDAIALIDEQPGTDAVSALLATIEFLDD